MTEVAVASQENAPGVQSRWGFPWVILPLLASVLAWGLLFAVLPPADQDFPLNDAWMYDRGAMFFAAGKGIHYSKINSMPQLGQWLWSVPFIALFSASHVVLRISAIVLGWLGLIAFYDLLRQEQVTPPRAAFGAATLAFNPWFFVSQGTYMTDVPALSFALMGLACYGRALRWGHIHWLVPAVIITLMGVITRQNVLAVPLVAAYFLWRNRALRWRVLWLLAVLLPLIVGVATHLWFNSRPDVEPLGPQRPKPIMMFLIPYLIFHFCGLAVLPVLLAFSRPGTWRAFIAALGVLLLAAWWLARNGASWPTAMPHGGLFPYRLGLLGLWGAGSEGLTLGDETRDLLLSRGWRIGLTVAGCIGGAALIARLFQSSRERALLQPLMLFTLLQALLLFVSPAIFDRYFMFLMPGAIALLAIEPAGAEVPSTRLRWIGGLAVLALVGLVSVGLMHDWLSWNRARWELGSRALAKGIPARDIEGGFEWDGWNDPAVARGEEPGHDPTAHEPRGLILEFTGHYYPWVRGLYALSFCELPDSTRVDAVPYSTWLPPRQKQFFLLMWQKP